MINNFKKLQRRYRYSVILLRQMVVSDFKLRYQGSVLGYVWSLLRPLFLFVILYIVFVKFLHIGDNVPHYPLYLLLGIVLWNFFAEVTSMCVNSIVSRGELIRKLNFPKYVIIVSTAVSALINLVLNLVVFSLFMALNKMPLHIDMVWAPLFIGEIFIFALAVGFILSALFVRLRDIGYIWEVMLQALFYATPIIYPLTMVSQHWPKVAKLLLLNPVGQAIQDIRYLVVTNQAETLQTLTRNWVIIAVPFAVVILTTLGAIFLFKKRSPYFAEEV